MTQMALRRRILTQMMIDLSIFKFSSLMKDIISLTISSSLVNSPIAAQAWVRADNMVGTWIINSISPKLQGSIIYRDTTLEIWTDLRDPFSQGNGTKIFNI